MFQLKYFEPVWGDNKSSNSTNSPVSKLSYAKYNKLKPVAAVPVSNTTVTTINATATMCSSSDDVKNEDVPLDFPWDTVDSTTDVTMTPLIEEVIIQTVSNFIFITLF